MFDSRYYKNRIIYRLIDDYEAMVEVNLYANENYIFLPDTEKVDDYAIYLRKGRLDPNRIVCSLSEYLEKNGFTDRDFANPFKRTKRIVRSIDIINYNKKNGIVINKPKEK